MVRKKSASAHRKVLDAALSLFAERGIDASSMDAIAESSGVSKATIYKHWPDKDALALEALGELFGIFEEAPVFDCGDLRQDFVDALVYQPAGSQELKNRLMPHVMAYAASHQQFGEQWRERVMERPQLRLKALLKRGITQGRLRSPIDPNTALAQLLGPMLYWHIFVGRRAAIPVPKELAATVVDTFWKAYGEARRGKKN